MPIILISSDAIDSEQKIAKATAEKLGYQLLGPDILPDIASKNGSPAEKVSAALVKLPSTWLPGQSRQWLQHLATVEADVLDRLKAGRIVCWGLPPIFMCAACRMP